MTDTQAKAVDQLQKC